LADYFSGTAKIEVETKKGLLPEAGLFSLRMNTLQISLAK
jgi:hypothetical protein